DNRIIDKRRHLPHRVDRKIFRLFLLTFGEINPSGFPLEPFFQKGDARFAHVRTKLEIEEFQHCRSSLSRIYGERRRASTEEVRAQSLGLRKTQARVRYLKAPAAAVTWSSGKALSSTTARNQRRLLPKTHRGATWARTPPRTPLAAPQSPQPSGSRVARRLPASGLRARLFRVFGQLAVLIGHDLVFFGFGLVDGDQAMAMHLHR